MGIVKIIKLPSTKAPKNKAKTSTPPLHNAPSSTHQFTRPSVRNAIQKPAFNAVIVIVVDMVVVVKYIVARP